MDLQLLRHATLQVVMNGKILLVDPMFGEKEEMEPIINSPNDNRNPLVEMPVPCDSLLAYDAVLLTHTHRDHFDAAAARLLPKNKPVICQPEDKCKLAELGFFNILDVQDRRTWEGINFLRTGGQHGTGEIARRMAPVSGYLLLMEQDGDSLYIAGDTVFCREVEAVLRKNRPRVTVVNAGEARFRTGDPITMTAADVIQVCRLAPETKVIAVHMEAINHCLLTRSELRSAVRKAGLTSQVFIPGDGENLKFPPAQ
jgi:L-ascorbate metabolism protein UlaG (beta-lactamase superfamily)